MINKLTILGELTELIKSSVAFEETILVAADRATTHDLEKYQSMLSKMKKLQDVTIELVLDVVHLDH